MGLFKDWGITNIDLRREVARKIPKKKISLRKDLNQQIILVENMMIMLNL